MVRFMCRPTIISYFYTQSFYFNILILGGLAEPEFYISLCIFVCVAAYVSLCAIILVEFLGLEKLSNSFGFLNMFRGIATFIGAPLAGE